ncbi:hypothetical protein OA84_02825 [Kaistella solincola]|uniref:Glycosyltransferase family 4 protein n=1 Tax=Kaistella solincola TaxID=510955 RepID=A0ABR4ZTE1_9FLAO|nr:glycosyltransferase [Kaistella solincola]KIA84474.1 hypothetical protein OA84_02825 [Kaistella solincola]
MRYKILFISSWFPNKLEPTNGNFVQRHAEAVALRHDVEVLHAIGDPAQKELYIVDDQEINGIRTLIVYYKKSINPARNFFRRMKAYQRGFSQMQKPDLVHANILFNSVLFAVYLKRKHHIPFVVSEHWSGFLEINRAKRSKLKVFLAHQIAKNASAILPVSKSLQNDMKILGFTGCFHVVENVVNMNVFPPKRHQPQKFIFLHISNLIQLKNPEKILAAALRLRKEFTNFEMHIGGDGEVENLNRIISRHKAGDFVKTFSTLKIEEVAEKMRESSCFVLFSDYENFPCVLLESLSSGTPVIATNVGGIKEIVNGRNGILIRNSEDELYDAMKTVLLTKIDFDKPEILHQYIEHCFSMETISRKFDEVYRKILH